MAELRFIQRKKEMGRLVGPTLATFDDSHVQWFLVKKQKQHCFFSMSLYFDSTISTEMRRISSVES